MRAKSCALRTCVCLAVCGLMLAQSTTISTLPPVYFNHATVFISSAAYDVLRHSAFLRDEFSGMQEQTVQRDGGQWSYTGVYIYGQHTYLEFFKAGLDQPRYGTTIAGQMVLNMWIDDRRQLPRFKDRLAAEDGASLLIDTARNARNEPMYDSVVSQTGLASDFGPGMRIDTHLKGYYPDGVTREQRLEGRFLDQRELHDITGFALTVDQRERDRLIKEFRALSYEIKADGADQVVFGPGITFRLVPAKSSGRRALIINFSMNRTLASEKTQNFDEGGEIRLAGNTGQWRFNFPNELR